MKYSYFVVVVLFFVLFSCKSKEEKASELIKSEMFKTLHDFSSYEPIETTIDSAYTSFYRDRAILAKAYSIKILFKKGDEKLEAAKRAQEEMDVWGDRYSSYSSTKWDQAKEKAYKNVDEVKLILKEVKKAQNETYELIRDFTPELCGWEVKHKFRCKNRGGNYYLSYRLFIIDFDFKKIIYTENLEDKELIDVRKLIDEIKTIGEE